MVIIHYCGGLGNQMFQYAMGYSIAANYQHKISHNLDWYKEFSKKENREFLIDKFPLDNLEWIKEEQNHILDQIHIYWYHQNPNNFEKYRENLKKMFNIPHESLSEGTTAIHIRRCDYVQLNRTIGGDYYNNAMEILGSTNTMVFSDDPEWAQRLNLGQVYPSVGIIEDMLTMSTAERFIIANSTYSWWAAYLSGKSDVIYPKELLNNNINLGLKNWKML